MTDHACAGAACRLCAARGDEPAVDVRAHPVSPARTTDPATSHAAAARLGPRAGTQRRTVLGVYVEGEALTDAQAAARAGLLGTRASWWKRCSELREGGYLAVVGLATDPTTGQTVQTSALTARGLAAMRAG